MSTAPSAEQVLDKAGNYNPAQRVAAASHRKAPASASDVIQVDAFLASRSADITELENVLKAKHTIKRAFQSLPRHLRRRAASHDVKRVPSRLRKRAISEMKEGSNYKEKTRKETHKRSSFDKRQGKKQWLETHVWHAKRMHMTEQFGFRIAQKPTEKMFRAGYRASRHGALIHDASYFRHWVLEGSEADLVSALKTLHGGAGPSPWTIRYIGGVRVCETLLTLDSCIVGPITVRWDVPGEITNESVPHSDQMEVDALEQTQCSAEVATDTQGHHDTQAQHEAQQEGRFGLQGDALGSILNDAPRVANNPKRSILIQFHPAMLESIKTVEFHPLNIESRILPPCSLLSFELTGQRVNQVLKACLRPIEGDGAKKRFWNALDAFSGPSAVPTGLVAALTVYDPRLSFPPQMVTAVTTGAPADLTPSAELARAGSWDAPVPCTQTKGELDARRAAQLVPGTPLKPLANDARVPVTLTQRTLNGKMHAWTLTVPRGWGMAFWMSLVFADVRVGGLQQRQQQHFESGLLSFPDDYVGTMPFARFNDALAAEAESYYARRPKANRPNYAKLGTDAETAFRVNLPHIIAKWTGESTEGVRFRVVLGNAVREMIREQEKVKGLKRDKSRSRVSSGNDVLLVRGPGPTNKLGGKQLVTESSVSPPLPLFDERNLRHTCQSEYLTTSVRIVPIHRGSLERLGLVYFVRRELVDSWGDEIKLKALPESFWENVKVFGQITTGAYALMEGKPQAVAHVFLSPLLHLYTSSTQPVVLFKNTTQDHFRKAFIELM